jgi:hypothetical protein
MDPIMAFCSNLREKVLWLKLISYLLFIESFYLISSKDIFMYGTNLDYYGHLINTDTFNTSLIRPEMYQIIENFDVNYKFKSFLYNYLINIFF